jgi:plastocyanin
MRTPLPRLALAVLCAGGLSAAPAPRPATGTIHGRVHVPSPVAPAGYRPGVSDLAGGPHAPVDRRRCVVYLDPAPRYAFEDLPAGRARMDQRNEQFVPHLLAITVGTTVDFPNDDTTFHNVFSLSRVKSFDLGRYPRGHSKSVVFDKPGVVPVSCDIHSHMSAYILVFSHPFFAMTDDDGRYTITGVPPGTYTLMVWSELGHAEPRRVTVPDGGAAEVDFDVSRRP